jgi:hypothetical protein
MRCSSVSLNVLSLSYRMQRMWKWIRGIDLSSAIDCEHITCRDAGFEECCRPNGRKGRTLQRSLVRLRDNFLAHIAVLTKVALLEAGE